MKKRYLVLPVNDTSDSECKHYRLFKDAELVYDFNAALDFRHKAFDSYIDITRFGDSALTLEDDFGNAIPFAESDKFPQIEEINNGTYLRPFAHYTTSLGWINDPNGLIFVNGRYHMFYQHNPHGIHWGNMTWGHAVSENLVNWEELGDILFPDEMGTMYSGCAYCDRNNAAGFGDNAILLFYTAAGKNSELSKNQPFTQCLAYSLDDGATFIKYDKNPIIPHISGDNRDPKVEWSSEIGKYTLSLYLQGNDYAIYASDDLLHWDKISDINMPEDNECPDFYPLPVSVDGKDMIKWVFSGAHDTYIIGSIREGKFVEEQPYLKYHHAPGVSYAAQTFSGCDSDSSASARRIKIAWGQNNALGAVFNSQMGIPCEMYLKQIGEFIRLGSYPVSEIELMSKTPVKFKINGSGTITVADMDYLRNCAADVYIEIGDSAPFTLSGYGMEIIIDPVNGTYTHGDCTAPLSYSGKKHLRVIFDTLGAEIFADNGLIYSTIGKIGDSKCGIKIIAEHKIDVQISVAGLSK